MPFVRTLQATATKLRHLASLAKKNRKPGQRQRTHGSQDVHSTEKSTTLKVTPAPNDELHKTSEASNFKNAILHDCFKVLQTPIQLCLSIMHCMVKYAYSRHIGQKQEKLFWKATTEVYRRMELI